MTKYVPGKTVWSYQYLPNDLVGTKEGYIKGKFGNKGSYSFAAVCSNEEGARLNFIMTLNVQPDPDSYVSYRESDDDYHYHGSKSRSR